MRRIETGRTDISPRSGKAGFTINGILGAQSIAVVLYQPQVVLIAECLHSRQIKGISQSMCDHHRLGFGRERSFQFRNINIVLGNRHIHKNRHRAILNGRSHSSGEATGNGDDLVPLLDLTITQFRCSQCHEGNQVCRRPTVDQMSKLDADPLGKLLLELVCKTASCQPEIQSSIRQCTHFLFIKHTCGIGNAVSLFIRLLFLLKIVVVLSHHRLNLISSLCFILPSRHL